VRTSTTGQDGQPIDEWWSVVIVGQTFPIAGRGLGYQRHAGQVTAFQTPRGELDRYDKLYRVMAHEPAVLSHESQDRKQSARGARGLSQHPRAEEVAPHSTLI